MGITQNFIGWDKPTVEAVRSFFRRRNLRGRVLTIVPCSEAYRQLSEDGGWYGTLLTPRELVRSNGSADTTTCLAVWATILESLCLTDYAALFPTSPPRQDLQWALQMAESLQKTRYYIGELGFTLDGFMRKAGDLLEEQARMEELLEVEKLYINAMTANGLVDPIRDMLLGAADVCAEYQHIIVACVPDIVPVAALAVEKAASTTSVDILIQAPEEMAPLFDLWGRPVSGSELHWGNVALAPENVVFCDDAADQAKVVAEYIGNDKFAELIVADRSAIVAVSQALRQGDYPIFDPGARAFAQHRLGRLIDSVCRLRLEDSYAAGAALLRSPDILMQVKEPAAVLKELDRWQANCLPSSMRMLNYTDPLYSHLAAAWMELKIRLDVLFAATSVAEGLAIFLDAVCVIPTTGAASDALGEILDRVRTVEATGLFAGKTDVWELLHREIRSLTYHEHRPETAMSLHGWIDGAWTAARNLMVVGMNEGIVPEKQAGCSFAPEQVLKALGLPHDQHRLACAAYQLRVLMESRENIVVTVGRWSNKGDALRPSRALFLGDDEALLGRVQQYLETRSSVAPAASGSLGKRPFVLSVPAKRAIPSERLYVRDVSPSRLADYLACPFRYFLKRVLKMESAEVELQEMNALLFGELLHDTVAALIDIRDCDDAKMIADFLFAKLEREATQRFGTYPNPAVMAQLWRARRRLRRLAVEQARLVSEGWRIEAVEQDIKPLMLDSSGTRLQGRLDRVDVHRETSRWRIIDYKTGERARNPKDVHLVRATRGEDYSPYAGFEIIGSHDSSSARYVWKNLQLPLYAAAVLQGKDGSAIIPEVAYLNMSAETDAPCLAVWDGFDSSVIAGAMTCAAGVVADLKAGRFWPPTEGLRDAYSGRLGKELAAALEQTMFSATGCLK